jgi:hypothetical protein
MFKREERCQLRRRFEELRKKTHSSNRRTDPVRTRRVTCPTENEEADPNEGRGPDSQLEAFLGRHLELGADQLRDDADPAAEGEEGGEGGGERDGEVSMEDGSKSSSVGEKMREGEEGQGKGSLLVVAVPSDSHRARNEEAEERKDGNAEVEALLFGKDNGEGFEPDCTDAGGGRAEISMRSEEKVGRGEIGRGGRRLTVEDAVYVSGKG